MMIPMQLPFIVITDTDGTPWEDDEDIGAVVTVAGSSIQVPLNGYVDLWGDGGQTPQSVVADIMQTLVQMAVERINERESGRKP